MIRRLASSAADNTETITVNDGQSILLIGPSFSARCLAVCDYLTAAADPSRMSIECWSVNIHGTINDPILSIDLVFPPSSTRALIESRREEARQSKYAHDPERKTTVAALIQLLNHREVAGKELFAYPGKGGVYRCRLWLESWPEDVELLFNVDRDNNWMVVPAKLQLTTEIAGTTQSTASHSVGGVLISWVDRDLANVQDLADLLAALVAKIVPISA